MPSEQNPRIRRAYLIRPRAELRAAIQAVGLADDTDFLTQPTVTMTAPLPYEEKLEGYRSLVLTKCKQAFIRDLFEYEPLADHQKRRALLGEIAALEDGFDRWWTAEEIETIEIPTTW